MRRHLFMGLVLLAVGVPLPGETLVGLTAGGALVRFDTATPGTFSAPITITGTVAGDAIVAIDRRPATGQLYALGVNGTSAHLYTLDEATGAATQIGGTVSLPESAGVAGAGTDFAFDFNPVVDRIRVITNNQDNFRLNPTNGTVAGADTALNPGTPVVVGAAYTNNVSGATSTTLYAIDTSANQLVIIGGNPVPPGASPNGGVATAVGSLGVATSSNEVGFEISPSGTAFAALQVGGTSSLYSITPGTGGATLVGSFAGGTTIRDLAIGAGDVTVVKSHTGAFTAGQSGANYSLVVSNGGPGPTNGTITVVDTLPAGMTATAISGTGWTCTLGTLTCTRSDVLLSGASYPAITLTVNIALTTSGTATNTATVSEPGEGVTTNNSSSDPVTIAASAAVPTLSNSMLLILALGLAAIALLAKRV